MSTKKRTEREQSLYITYFNDEDPSRNDGTAKNTLSNDNGPKPSVSNSHFSKKKIREKERGRGKGKTSNSYPFTFEERLSQLADYKRIYGNTNVPCK